MRLRLTGWLLSALILALGMIAVIPAPAAVAQNTCSTLPSRDQLQAALVNAASGTGISGALGPGTNAGGVFGGARMWGAIVDRRGEVCFAVTSTPDPTQVWPISQAIAKAK